MVYAPYMSLPDVYMHSVKNLPSIFEKLTSAGVPDRFTHEFLKQLGFTSSNDRAFPNVLRALRFVDDNGVPTDRYKHYRDLAISRAVVAEALRDAYSDLFKVDERAQDMTNSQVTGAIKRITGKTDSVAQKMATTFKGLAKLADWDATVVPAPLATEEDGDAPNEVAESPRVRTALELRALHHDVHIHLPATTDVKVFDAIFRSLREHFQ